MARALFDYVPGEALRRRILKHIAHQGQAGMQLCVCQVGDDGKVRATTLTRVAYNGQSIWIIGREWATYSGSDDRLAVWEWLHDLLQAGPDPMFPQGVLSSISPTARIVGRRVDRVDPRFDVWELVRASEQQSLLLGDVFRPPSPSPSPPQSPTTSDLAAVRAHHAARDWLRVDRSLVPGAGRGVFARVPFAPGQLITLVAGCVSRRRDMPFMPYMVEANESDRRRAQWRVWILEDEARGDPWRWDGLGMFVNSADFLHEEDPGHGGNVRYVCIHEHAGAPPAFYIEAFRPIEAGDELLVPTYGIDYWRNLMQWVKTCRKPQ